MAAGFRQNFDEWKNKLDEALHEKNRVNDVLEKIETKTGVKRLHIVLGLIALTGIYLMVGYGSDFLCNLIGFVYPAYASIQNHKEFVDYISSKMRSDRRELTRRKDARSGIFQPLRLWMMTLFAGWNWLCDVGGICFKAIETKQKDDDTKWLTYWVVYAVFSLVEYFTDIFLFWIPLYWFLKCVFLMYLMAPTSWNGSVTIYYKCIRPLALRHEKKIDSGLEKAVDAGRAMFDEAKNTTKEAVSDAAKKHFDTKLE